MPVFQPYVLERIMDAIPKIANEYFSRTSLILDTEEFIDAFISPEHIGQLQSTQALVGSIPAPNARVPVTSRGGVDIELARVGTPKILVPKYTEHGMCQTASIAVRGKILDYVDQRIQQGLAFGLVAQAIKYFDTRCSTAQQMATYVPCLPMIMAFTEEGEKAKPMTRRANKLVHNKSAKDLPLLPVSTRKALAEASALVSAYTLIKQAPAQGIRNGQVHFSLGKINRQQLPDSPFPDEVARYLTAYFY